MVPLLCVFVGTLIALAQGAVNPVVFFPGYSFSKLSATVTDGQVPDCPSSGSFVVEYGMADPQNGFSQTCMFNYLNLTYNPTGATGKKWSSRSDVTVIIPGREQGDITQCVGDAGLYQGFFSNLTANGYSTGSVDGGATLLGACYDWRIDPTNDAISGPSFLENTKTLIETAYSKNNKTVWLVGHSNGPIMALYFLNQMSQSWKDQHIAGFIPLSGNFAGVGAFIAAVFLDGLSVVDFSFFAGTQPIMQYWSANLFSAAQPSVFVGSNNVIVLTTLDPPRNYTVTENDIDAIYTEAGLTLAKDTWRDLVGLVGPHTPPNVYTYAFWGSGFDTAVGVIIESFQNTAIVDYILRNGDVNQEDVDNESIKVWNQTMPTGCFKYEQIDGVDHFHLTSNVATKILDIINQGTPNTCSFTTATATTGSSSSVGGATTGSASTSGSVGNIVLVNIQALVIVAIICIFMM